VELKVTEDELWARFDKALSAPNKELLWQWLKQDQCVTDVCSGRSEWNEFKDAALRLANRQRETLRWGDSMSRSREVPDVHVPLTDLEQEHAAALRPYLAKRAALLPDVRGFRKEKLGGEILNPDQIIAFLRKELSYLPAQQYAVVQPSLKQILSHSGGISAEELKDLVAGWEQWSGETRTEHWLDESRRAIELRFVAVPRRPSQQSVPGLMYFVRDHTGRTLEDISRSLVTRYPWALKDAAWFVLTDEPPKVECLKIQDDKARGRYMFTFASWVSEKTVRFAYHRVQPKDNRPLSTKGLAAFRFVDEYTEPGRTPKWAELTRRWNEQHPEDKFRDRSALRQAYERARERLAYPWKDKLEYQPTKA
jgi:hypothetical protein